MRMRWFSRSLLVTMVVLCALILMACGGGDATATTAPSGQTTTQITTAASGVAAAATTTVAGTTAPGASAASPRPAGGVTGSPTTNAGGSAATAERYAIVPGNSKATYKVNETFFGQGLSTAVGSSGEVKGDIYIDKQKPSNSRIDTITVDISKLQSDSARRDRAIQNDWLESATHPTATFKAKRLVGLPDTPYTDGQELNFQIVGDLTVRNVTKEVTFDAKAKVVGDTLTGTATTNFNMTDFGFDPPVIAGTLKAENGVILEMEIEAKRAP